MVEKSHIEVSVVGYRNVTVPEGTSLLELKRKLNIKEDPHVPIVGALYNNRVMGLEYQIRRRCTVEFITTGTEEGADIYRRSLSLLLHAAFLESFSRKARLKIEYSLSKGYFYTYIDEKPLTEEEVKQLEKLMMEMVELNLPIIKTECETEDAIELFRHIGAWDRYYLLKYRGGAKTVVYTLKKCCNLAQGPLVPSTGYLRWFSLIFYPPGLILTFPTADKPREIPEFIEQNKLFQIYSEQREWSKILDVDSAGKLNRHIVKGRINELIWLSEGLHEKKIAYIADLIAKNSPRRRIIFLAGPSSSGKTTFAKRLTIQLLANGISPEVLSLDNYYLPRYLMPRNSKGEIDFDSIEALDLELIRKHLKALLEGKRVDVPVYDFKTGKREKETVPLRLRSNQVVIIEGIHGMNPQLTGLVEEDEVFKIYISALTQLNLDVINRIPTSTVRLIRRIVRDYQFRAFSARQTIAKWPLVRQGEDKNIFPFQEEADVMFNSSLVYEMSVLKGYVEPLLLDIGEQEPAYTTARMLLHFTSNFIYISPEKVPLTSILREFIGGSGFVY